MLITFATRPSALARWQTHWVSHALKKIWPDLECLEQVITTQGDLILDKPLPEIGGKGLFTQELEAELLTGHVHAAVHSLKDLPVESQPGLTIGAIPARADVRDVLISPDGYSLETLPEGAFVGTSSLRRSAQLLAYRPDLCIMPLRGNVDTRLRKVQEGQYAAIILAGAGVSRLGLEAHITQWLPLEIMLPAPGQGALAVQCRADDIETLQYLSALDDPAARATTLAERSFLAGLGGGCSLPIAAYGSMNGNEAEIELLGLAASPDGKQLVRGWGTGVNPVELGNDLAAQVLAQGAGEFLHV